MSLEKNSLMIHDLADVQSLSIGMGTRIWQFSVILPGAVIGKNCNINALTLIENDVVIGDNVTVKSGVQVWDGLRIEDNVFIGPNVTFTNDFTPRSQVRSSALLKTTLESHASIGANATIVGGITIRAYSLVGAGSVVTKDVPKHGLVYGNPAKLQGYVCKCGSTLENMACKSCGSEFVMNRNIVCRKEKEKKW